MKTIGLTGSMGCGKSTVASLLSEMSGVAVLDCDQVAKAILSDKKNWEKITEALEENVFSEMGAAFKRISEIIFVDLNKKRALERVLHPLVWQEVNDWVVRQTDSILCVVESAIIFETEMQEQFDAVVTVSCDSLEQLRRLRENRGMSSEQIEARLSHQFSIIEKEDRSQFVVRTDCDLEELSSRVEKLYQQLTQ